MVYGSESEKPTSRRFRIVVVAVCWLIGIPVMVGLWFWFGWWVLILVAAAAWATFDYLKRGDQLGQVDRFTWGW